jgi:hypothetical protein
MATARGLQRAGAKMVSRRASPHGARGAPACGAAATHNPQLPPPAGHLPAPQSSTAPPPPTCRQVLELPVLVRRQPVRVQRRLRQVQPPLQVGAARSVVDERPDEPARGGGKGGVAGGVGRGRRRCLAACRRRRRAALPACRVRPIAAGPGATPAAPALGALQLALAGAAEGGLVLCLELSHLGAGCAWGRGGAGRGQGGRMGGVRAARMHPRAASCGRARGAPARPSSPAATAPSRWLLGAPAGRPRCGRLCAGGEGGGVGAASETGRVARRGARRARAGAARRAPHARAPERPARPPAAPRRPSASTRPGPRPGGRQGPSTRTFGGARACSGVAWYVERRGKESRLLWVRSVVPPRHV